MDTPPFTQGAQHLIILVSNNVWDDVMRRTERLLGPAGQSATSTTSNKNHFYDLQRFLYANKVSCMLNAGGGWVATSTATVVNSQQSLGIPWMGISEPSEQVDDNIVTGEL